VAVVAAERAVAVAEIATAGSDLTSRIAI